MQKVFLSHSSADKESYVRIVAKKLINNIGEENIILDEITFQQARKTIEEIAKWLNDNKKHVIHEFTVSDLNHLYRGGRLSKASAVL